MLLKFTLKDGTLKPRRGHGSRRGAGARARGSLTYYTAKACESVETRQRLEFKTWYIVRGPVSV